VTQHNAAAAEELSSTAEEMSSQAEALQQMMVSLQEGQFSHKNKTGTERPLLSASPWPARSRAGFHVTPAEHKSGKNGVSIEVENPVSVKTDNDQEFKRF
jgi:methyl-accepting chemotaxis protein